MKSENPFLLTEFPILITGASSGIGKETSLLLSRMGARCALVGRDRDRLEHVLESLSGEGHHLFQVDDLCGSEPQIIQAVVSAIGPLRGLVHSAGIEQTLPFRSIDSEDLDRMMDVNFRSFWSLCKSALKRGNHVPAQLSVVGISSVAGLYGSAGKASYSASKGALMSLVRSLAAEYAPKRLRFNCVCPGYVDTPMLQKIRDIYSDEESFCRSIIDRHPLGLGSPEDVAGAVCFLLSDAARWVTGSVLSVDGGYGVR